LSPRPLIKAKAIKADFAAALTLAKTGEPDYLPGRCGPRHSAPQPSGTAKKQNAAESGKRADSSSAPD